MEQEFDGETVSVSEDSGDDENDENEEDEHIESAMGEVGDKSDVVDEKLGENKDEEDHNENEKYEQGASVKDQASQDEELRAKEDSEATKEDAIDLDAKEASEKTEENGDEEEGLDGEEDMKVDKDDAYTDPSGINPDVQDQTPEEETPVDELDGTEPMEDGEEEEEENLEDSDLQNEEKGDEVMEEADPDNSVENPNAENDKEMDVKIPEQDTTQSDPNENASQSAGKQTEDFAASTEQGDSAPDEKSSDTSELKNNLNPTNGQPSASDLEMRVADSTNGQELNQEQSRTSLTPSDSHDQKAQPNPCRSIGDALEGWKERVKVSVDLEDKLGNSDDMVEDADEYGYTAEFKEGTAQALGPATADQVKGDITQNETETEAGGTETRDQEAEVEIEKRSSETNPVLNSALSSSKDAGKQLGSTNMEEDNEESMEVDDDYNRETTDLSESLVSIKRSFISEEMRRISASSMKDDDENEDELGKFHKFEASAEKRDEAALVWRKYESLTTRLSQELAEQLRLVMEPTLASKLQGDYRTGKRINMKKVCHHFSFILLF